MMSIKRLTILSTFIDSAHTCALGLLLLLLWASPAHAFLCMPLFSKIASAFNEKPVKVAEAALERARLDRRPIQTKLVAVQKQIDEYTSTTFSLSQRESGHSFLSTRIRKFGQHDSTGALLEIQRMLGAPLQESNPQLLQRLETMLSEYQLIDVESPVREYTEQLGAWRDILSRYQKEEISKSEYDALMNSNAKKLEQVRIAKVDTNNRYGQWLEKKNQLLDEILSECFRRPELYDQSIWAHYKIQLVDDRVFESQLEVFAKELAIVREQLRVADKKIAEAERELARKIANLRNARLDVAAGGAIGLGLGADALSNRLQQQEERRKELETELRK